MRERLKGGLKGIEEGSYLVYRHGGSIVLIRVLGVDQLRRQGILPPVRGRRGSRRRREIIPGEIKLRECRAEHRFIEGRHRRGRYTGGAGGGYQSAVVVSLKGMSQRPGPMIAMRPLGCRYFAGKHAISPPLQSYLIAEPLGRSRSSRSIK